MAVVSKEERSATAGITVNARPAGAAISPLFRHQRISLTPSNGTRRNGSHGTIVIHAMAVQIPDDFWSQHARDVRRRRDSATWRDLFRYAAPPKDLPSLQNQRGKPSPA
jgi:hypothetical protein